MSSLPKDLPAASRAKPRATADTSATRRTTLWALAGGLMIWLAFPPVGAAPLAWLGMAIWVWLCRAPRPYAGRDYGGIYLASLIHWLLIVHWVRLPHWSAWFGWFALSAYLAVYLPLFILLVRRALRLGVPLILAAPVVWTGLESIRARAFTGFAMALLGHTQAKIPVLIQIADLFGAYAVSFVIVLVSAAAAAWMPLGQQAATRSLPRAPRSAWASALVALLILVGTLAYGQHRLAAEPPESQQTIRVALIQGSIDTVFDGLDHTAETLSHYTGLSRAASAEDGPFDLLVWPESMYAFGWVTVDETEPMFIPDSVEQSATAYRENKLQWQRASVDQARLIGRALGTRMLVGAPREEYGPKPAQRFNSAMYLDSDGTQLDLYDKMHRVLFGEYIPLGNLLPWLYRLSPMGSGLTTGSTPKCFQVNDVGLAPSICFENTVPHLMRRQYLELRERGVEPDALVTITNDGWFWGSSLLDVHLACGVFRAIELQRPLLIAANTGFSAWIDPQGRVLQRGPRRATGTVVATVGAREPSESVYLAWGDLPVGFCAACCGLLAVALGFSAGPVHWPPRAAL